ncbi:MAG: ABC transporter substrate-binding protein [Alphaproteobacteria bacterium]|nr:ABC transporter substrate-binding protein [Rhodospirillaceae bacterium]MBT6512154.1 ABC transporter substrate-binding protein [Rhodospirillaceae bacterium]MBT7612833.1 ABC transporter substrate-binding protein [Rhodospirillaceae bacterium]MBT7648381.1 ABC transporter substrate-binding protein [Rhodospirillaceae bacterium]MDG2479643.1 ABC transporter substrate-binding protein [Alphaproteobacteria bacterium]
MTKKELLKSEFMKGKVSRRDFNAGLMGMGLSAVAATTFVNATIKEAEASGPQRGGHLLVASQDDVAGGTIDPILLVNWSDLDRNGPLSNRLLDVKPGESDDGLVPSLAIEWEPNADGSEWYFRLRKGVEFHNGKTMTSADVVHSLNRHLVEGSPSPANAYLSSVTEFATDGDDMLVVKLNAPNADLPTVLSEYHFTVQPDDSIDYNLNYVGTGAWKIEELEWGIGSIFTRHENYWNEDRPYIDSIEIFGIPDNSTRFNALLTGEADIIRTVETNFVEALNESDDAWLVTAPSGSHLTYPMRMDMAPFDNNDVRLAVKNAVDRDKFNEIAFNGLGTVGRDHPIPPFDPMHCDEIPLREADPDKVAYHLKQAGMENAEFELNVADSLFGGAAAGEAFASLARENGLNVSARVSPSDGYWGNVWMVEPWSGSSWAGRPVADMILSIAYKGGGDWNETFMANDRFDSLLEMARAESDFAKRKEMYCEMQWILYNDGGQILPVFLPWLDGASSRVKGLKASPYGAMGYWYWDDMYIDDGAA